MSTISPIQIYNHINKYVVGQEEAKRVAATALFLHVVRYSKSVELMKPIQFKNNILLTGPTGVGKTHIIRAGVEGVRDLLNLPLCPLLEVDCTELSTRGWEGDNITDIIRDHYDHVGSNEAEFNSTVVFLDEIDKICKTGVGAGGSDHNRATQYNLLKVVEGMKVPRKKQSSLNTNKMLFVFAGNFSELRVTKPVLGFTAEPEEEDTTSIHVKLDGIGMASQLVGRIGNVGVLNELNTTELEQILTRYVLPDYSDLWGHLGEVLYVPPNALKEMSQKCYERKTGARGLSSELSQFLENDLFNLEFKL